MTAERIDAYAEELYRAMRMRTPVSPLSEREPNISVQDAYKISQATLKRRLQTGERLIGKKIGLTSKAVQDMLNVDRPDFGYLTDAMVFKNGDEVPISRKLIQPKVEGEIAFILKRDLPGTVSAEDVLDATAGLLACFEIVDSRIANWQIKIQDTVADNASCGFVVLGDEPVDPSSVDVASCRLEIEKNAEIIAAGIGADALGSPANCVAWLANTMSAIGTPLQAGEVIFSGSLVPLLTVFPGEEMRVRVSGIGETRAVFV